jgi:two-component system chemotaxis response regulator CheY
MADTILIVDDSSMVRRYVRRALEGLGFDVREAADGASALRMVEECVPALLISDVNMAPMTGLELVEAVRRRHARDELPILMLTTEADDAMKQRGKQAGANGWLVKPFEPTRMSAVIQHLLARSRRAGENEGQAS